MFYLTLSDACATILGVVYFIRELLNILYIIIPIGLIVMISIDFAKGVINIDDGSKALKFVLTRVIYTAIIMLLPNVLFSAVSAIGVNLSDSKSCWNYFEDTNVEEVKRVIEQKSEALESKNENLQDTLNQQNYVRYNAISNYLSSNKKAVKGSSNSTSSSSTSSTGECTKTERIRLTAFNDSSLRNSFSWSNVGTVNGSWRTYKYNGKTYLVLASAMKNTPWPNPVSSYNFNDFDVLTLKINGEVYDAIIMDVCGACAKSTNILKLDLWTSSNSQSWDDYQYLCKN